MSGSLVLEEYDTDEYQPTERGECHSYSCALSFLYSRISVALTTLRPWKSVLDMGNSCR